MQTLKLDGKFKRLFFLGDIHGEFKIIPYILRMYAIKDSLIVQVGDFGMDENHGRQERQLDEANASLNARGSMLVAIRGNHDNPAVFKNTFYRKNILLLEDYTMLDFEISGKPQRLLGIGGAHSIDRVKRKIDGQSYWPDEPVEMRPSADYLDQFTDINYMVTHTAPDGLEPYTMAPIVYHFAKNDDTLLDEIRTERREFARVMNYLVDKNSPTLACHFYGHFHFSSTSFMKGLMRRLLSINELYEVNVKVRDNIEDNGEGSEPSRY